MLFVSGIVVGWGMHSRSMNDDYQSYAPKHRPSRVPRYALWAGGADGGSYIDCHYMRESDDDDCTIYNDFTGDIEVSGRFVLQGRARGAKPGELRYRFFDGSSIVLDLPPEDGKLPSLVRKADSSESSQNR